MLSPQPLPLLGMGSGYGSSARRIRGGTRIVRTPERARGEEAGMESEIDSGVRRRAARRDRDAAGGPVID